MSNPPRTYQPLWDQLKSLPKEQAKSIGISVTARKHLHPRIVKAVKKEKWMDFAWKLTLGEKYQITVISHKSRYSVLTFYLTYSPSLEELGLT
jgi:hypothetical protein